MSRIWNPLAFDIFGNPNPIVAPPQLRVQGGTLTEVQALSAQNVFAKFCNSARLSSVPNPTEYGQLPDGSQYKIVDVAGNRTMLVWPRGAEETLVGFDGIYNIRTRRLLVNVGQVDDPGAEWKLVDPEWLPDDFSSYPPIDFQFSLLNVPQSSGYNPFAATTNAQFSRGVYFIGWPAPRAYGFRVAFVDYPPVGNQSFEHRTFGFDAAGRLGAFVRGDKKIVLLRSVNQGVNTTFPTPNKMPKKADYGETQPLVQFEITGEYDPGDSVIAFGPLRVSKSGGSFIAMETAYDPVTPSADIVDGYFEYDMGWPYGVSFFGIGVESQGTSWSANLSGLQYTEKNHRSRVIKGAASSSLDGIAVTELKALDPGQVSPKSKNIAFPGTTITGAPCVLVPTARPAVMHKRSYPLYTVTSTTPRYNPGGGYVGFNWVSEANGPVQIGVKYNEAYESLVSADFCGPDTPVVLVAAFTRDYEENVSGTLTGRYEAIARAGSGLPAPVPPPSTPVDAEGKRSVQTLQVSGHVSYSELSQCDVPGYGALVLKREDFSEAVSYNRHIDFEDFREPEPTLITLSLSSSFTLHREQRKLFVYDQALDFLCFSEMVVDLSGSSTGDGISVTRPALPSTPTPYLVMWCRGVETRIPLHFVPHSSNGSAPTEQQIAVAKTRLWPDVGAMCDAGPSVSSVTACGFYTVIGDGARGPGLGQDLPHDAEFVNNDWRRYTGYQTALRGQAPGMGWADPTEVRYMKTPITGGGFLEIRMPAGTDAGPDGYIRFVVDAAGLRPLDDVVPEHGFIERSVPL